MNEKGKIGYKFSVISIVILTFLIYGNSLWNNYSGDDGVFITDNSITMKGLERVREIFSDDGVLKGWLEKDKTTIEENGFRKRYRPLAQLTFATEVHFFGANPHISHFFNILLYCFTVLLIFIIFSKLSVNLYQSKWFLNFPFLLAIVFITHPVHTEVVANIKSRDEILALLFSLLSLYFILKFLENYGITYICLSFTAFFLALLSKENAITFLSIIPMTIYFFVPDIQKYNRKKYLSYSYILIPLILATLLFLIIRNHILGPDNPAWGKNIFNNYFVDCNVNQKYGIIFYSLGKYLQLLIFPYRLMCDYSIYEIPVVNVVNLLPVVSICIYLFLLIYAILKFQNHSVISYGILFYLSALSIYSNLFVSTGTALAERFLFIPSLGFCIIISYCLSVVIPKFIKNSYYKHSIPGILLIVVFSFYSYMTVRRNMEWKDWKTLYEADLAKSNNCARLNELYGELLFDGHNYKGADMINKVRIAKRYYLRALKIYPGYVNAFNLLAVCYYTENKNYDSTIYYFLQSLRKDSSQLQVYKNVVNVLEKKNDDVYNLNIYKELVKLNPVQPILNYLLGKSYLKNDKQDSAIYFIEKAVETDYGYSNAVNELISIYENKKYKQRDNFKTYIRLSQLYKLGKHDSKMTFHYLEKAIGKNPNNPEAFYNLGISYYYFGNNLNALAALKKANKLSPENKDIIRTILKIYQELGDTLQVRKYSKIVSCLR